MPNDRGAMAQEMVQAFEDGSKTVEPPSARFPEFDLNDAYAVDGAFAALRESGGRSVLGWKVGYANKAVWRVMKLDTLVWSRMYDDTVVHAPGGSGEFRLPYQRSPKIEPEIVFRLKRPLEAGGMDAPSALACVEWLALGFEIIDSPFGTWTFTPRDFVAAYGLHRGLVVGEPLAVTPENIASLAEALPLFKVRVSKGGEAVEEGSGRNSLRSPALCLAEFGGAMLARTGKPLAAGALISSGTLTAGHAIARGEEWSAAVEGLPLAALSLRLS